MLYRITDRPANLSLARVVIAALILAVGSADFLTGVRVSLQVFYLIPIALSVAWLDWRAGVATSVLCVIARQVSDYADGLHGIESGILIWNRLVDLGVYLAITWIFNALVTLHRDMESQIRHRTWALTEEISERERLEQEIMTITEKERWSIGHDLHDGLCQHFTGTALAAQSLVRRLEKDGQPTVPDAQRVVALIEDGIGQSRRMARGLLLVSVEVDGLVHALRELAAASYEQYRIPCDFHIEGQLDVADGVMATHLYRIAQEAVRNAARHAQAHRVEISVVVQPEKVTLMISDDGVGLDQNRRTHGMGLRIMAHRAQIIGAHFSLGAAPDRGTVVSCTWAPVPFTP